VGGSGNSVDELLEERVGAAAFMHDTVAYSLGRGYRYGVYFWCFGAFYSVILRYRDGSKCVMAFFMGVFLRLGEAKAGA
jgi:hypothetical protein